MSTLSPRLQNDLYTYTPEVKRGAFEDGLDLDRVCCHTFQSTGIKAYLASEGKLSLLHQLLVA